ADHLASGIGQRAAVEARLGFGAEHPVGAGIADRKEVAHGDVEPDPVVAAAGLQDQDAVTGFCGQPVGHDAAGGAGADDDIVEITLYSSRHCLFPPGLVASPCPVLGPDGGRGNPPAIAVSLCFRARRAWPGKCWAGRNGMLDNSVIFGPNRDPSCPSSIASPICNRTSRPGAGTSMKTPNCSMTCTARRRSSPTGCGNSAATKSSPASARPAWWA